MKEAVFVSNVNITRLVLIVNNVKTDTIDLKVWELIIQIRAQNVNVVVPEFHNFVLKMTLIWLKAENLEIVSAKKDLKARNVTNVPKAIKIIRVVNNAIVIMRVFWTVKPVMEVVFAKPMFRALVAINAKMDFITWMSIILTDVLFAIVLELRLNANQAIGDLK